MFGEERVNNLVALLCRVLVAFSVGQISVLVATILQFYVHSQEKTVYNCRTSTGTRRHGFAALRATRSFHGTCP